MKNSDKNFLEKVGVTALGVPAAMMAGEMARDVMDGNTGPSSTKDVKEKSKREFDAERLKDKMKKDEPTGSGKESLSKERNYKKGGKVAGKLATRGYGCVKK